MFWHFYNIEFETESTCGDQYHARMYSVLDYEDGSILVSPILLTRTHSISRGVRSLPLHGGFLQKSLYNAWES